MNKLNGKKERKKGKKKKKERKSNTIKLFTAEKINEQKGQKT